MRGLFPEASEREQAEGEREQAYSINAEGNMACTLKRKTRENINTKGTSHG